MHDCQSFSQTACMFSLSVSLHGWFIRIWGCLLYLAKSIWLHHYGIIVVNTMAHERWHNWNYAGMVEFSRIISINKKNHKKGSQKNPHIFSFTLLLVLSSQYNCFMWFHVLRYQLSPQINGGICFTNLTAIWLCRNNEQVNSKLKMDGFNRIDFCGRKKFHLCCPLKTA